MGNRSEQGKGCRLQARLVSTHPPPGLGGDPSACRRICPHSLALGNGESAERCPLAGADLLGVKSSGRKAGCLGEALARTAFPWPDDDAVFLLGSAGCGYEAPWRLLLKYW